MPLPVWYAACSCTVLTGRTRTPDMQIIAMYFFNHVGTKLEVWYYYSHSFPIFEFILLPASILVAFNVKTVFFAAILGVFAAFDAAAILWNQLMVSWTRGNAKDAEPLFSRCWDASGASHALLFCSHV